MDDRDPATLDPRTLDEEGDDDVVRYETHAWVKWVLIEDY